MKRREFMALSAAFGLGASFSNLFAKENFDLWGAPALPSVIIAVASLQGRLAKDYDVNLKIWKNPDQLRAGIANKSIKVTMAPSNVVANLASKGFDFKMLNILTFGLNTIMAKDDSIKDYTHLLGKKLVMPFKNDMPDIILHATLEKLGINAKEINISYVQTPPEALGLFLQKDYDAALLLEPLSSASILKGKKMGISVHRAINMQEQWVKAFENLKIPQAGIIVESDFYTANKDKFDIFEDDLKNALDWILNNNQSAAEIGSNYLQAPVTALANSFKNANLTTVKARDIADDIMHFFEILYKFNPKILGEKMPDKSLFL